MIKIFTIKLEKIYLVIISISILISCSDNNIKFKKDLQFFEESGWKGISNYDFKINERGTYGSGTDINIFLKAVSLDTTIILEYYKTEETAYFPDFFKVYEIKKQNDSLSYYRFVSLKRTDTLYDYTILSKKGYYYKYDDMVFMGGKYYYMNSYGELKGKQYRYYEKHKDSLDKVRGNDLPELPELD